MDLADTPRRRRVPATWPGGWLLLMLLALPVSAEPPALNPHLQAAFSLYDALEYDEALRSLGRARQWQSNTREDRIAIELLEGILAFEFSQAKRGRSAFARALALDPKATLPLPVSPKVTAALEQVRASLPASAPPPVPVPSEPAPAPIAVVSEAPRAPVTQPPLTGVERGAGMRSRLRLPVAIGGGVVAVGGVLAWGRARSLGAQVRDADPSIKTRARLDATLQQGRTFEKVGWALMGLGAATVAGSFLFLGESSPGAQASLLPTPEGAQLSLSWSLR
ncbi:hypothetical protein D7X55_08420 [Corallococcus sp. AB049A]|uniref:Tetratricopeptide repeat protein n=2 Tax=Corallococcus TaxID=83461 RepID=A0A3A8QL44_9BACT|nr:hypothetical protein D7X96_14520 [Corallococcus interemptor]RKI71953.1 hypothetical protein D7X55_08420 [Corallococcus sp. AB049A]